MYVRKMATGYRPLATGQKKRRTMKRIALLVFSCSGSGQLPVASGP